jgi:hypothetical protein
MSEDFLNQIANAGYSTAYGRDKCYSTYDIVHKTTSRLGIFGFCLALVIVVYPVLGKAPSIVLASLLIGAVPYYLNKYSTDQYLSAAKKLEAIERELQSFYVTIKNSPNFDFDQATKKLNKLNKAQSDSAMNSHIFGSDLYAHIKVFWTKKTNSRWFINQLNLSFTDKVPFSTVVLLLFIFLLMVASILAVFIIKTKVFQSYFGISC